MTQYELQLVMEMKDNLTNKLNRTEKELTKVQKQLDGIRDKANGSERALSKMGSAINSLNLKANIMLAYKFGKELWNMGVYATKVAGSFENIGKNMLIFTKDKDKKFQPLVAQAHYQRAIDYANATPFSTESTMKATGQLLLHKQNPFDENINGKKIKGKLELIGDTASALGQNIEDSAMAYTSALKGSFGQARVRLGITKKDVEDHAKTMGLANKKGQVDQKNIGVVLDDLMVQRYEGVMKAKQSTFNAQLSTFWGKLDTFIARAWGAGEKVSGSRKGSMLDMITRTITEINKIFDLGKYRALARRFMDSVAFEIQYGLVVIAAKFNKFRRLFEEGGIFGKETTLEDGTKVRIAGVWDGIKEEFEKGTMWVIDKISWMITEIMESVHSKLLLSDTFGPWVKAFDKIGQSSFFQWLVGGKSIPDTVTDKAILTKHIDDLTKVDELSKMSFADRIKAIHNELGVGKANNNGLGVVGTGVVKAENKTTLLDDAFKLLKDFKENIIVGRRFQFFKNQKIGEGSGIPKFLDKITDIGGSGLTIAKTVYEKGKSLFEYLIKFFDDILQLIPFGKLVSKITKGIFGIWKKINNYILKTIGFVFTELLGENIMVAISAYKAKQNGTSIEEERKKLWNPFGIVGDFAFDSQKNPYANDTKSMIPSHVLKPGQILEEGKNQQGGGFNLPVGHEYKVTEKKKEEKVNVLPPQDYYNPRLNPNAPRVNPYAPKPEKKEVKISFGDVHITNGMDEKEFFSKITQAIQLA